MVTQSWCSGLCLASFSSMTSDLCVFITLYPMGWFCFCSGLSLRGVMRILKTVLPQTFTTGTWRCSCQWRFWNVYTGQMCVPSIQNGLKEHSPMQGGADGLQGIHCILQNGTATFNPAASPQVSEVWCQCQLNSVRSGWPLHQRSVIQAGCRAKNMLLAEGQSPAACGSCHAVNDALQMSPGGTMRSMLIHLKSHQQQKGKNEMRRPGGSRCNSTILW